MNPRPLNVIKLPVLSTTKQRCPPRLCLIDTISISLRTIRESRPLGWNSLCYTFASDLIDCYLNPFLHQPPPLGVPQFVHSQPSIWNALPGDEVSLPCNITNAVMGVTYKRVWRRHRVTEAGNSSYTIIQQDNKYVFSGNHLIIRNVSEDDTDMRYYTCAITRLTLGYRPTSGSISIFLVTQVYIVSGSMQIKLLSEWL